MRLFYLTLLFLTALLSGCDQASPLPSLSITGRVQMRAQEWRTGQRRTLVLRFQDEGGYPCFNYGLVTDFERHDKLLRLTFTGVTAADGICLTAIGPASSLVDISTLPVGAYSLRLQVGNATTTGTLELQSTHITLTSSNPSLVEVPTPELRFMPSSIIWGTAVTSLPNITAAILGDSLRRLGATPTTLPQGIYSQFTVAANGLPEPPQVSPGMRALVLLADYQGPAERIQAYVQRTNAAMPGLNLGINTSAL
ncbi:hypothetical protein [Hymenobacter algoricola]|uniref:Lipoprotein n=1 Tax=Hymenobacter algoricola TaxID=486267 RepID=A0ABP7MLP2_9BACT